MHRWCDVEQEAATEQVKTKATHVQQSLSFLVVPQAAKGTKTSSGGTRLYRIMKKVDNVSK